MERLAQRDIDALLDYLRDLYTPRPPERLAAHLVGTIPELVPSDATSYNEIDLARGTTTWVAVPEVNSVVADGEHIFDRHMTEHPLIRNQQARPDPRVLRISDVVSADDWHRLELYQAFFRPARLEHQVAFALPPTATAMRAFALNRDGRDFSERDRTILTALQPHIATAIGNAEALDRLQGRLDWLSTVIEASGASVMLLDRMAQPTFATGQACARLWRYFGPRLRVHDRASGLPDPVREWVWHCMERLRAYDDVPPALAPLIAQCDDRRLVVRFSPPDGDGNAWLMIEEQALRHRTLPAERLGATPRQAEIIDLVVEGHTNQEIARTLGISPLTVRTHLEHIFERLGVRSRTELARLAATELTWEPVVETPSGA